MYPTCKCENNDIHFKTSETCTDIKKYSTRYLVHNIPAGFLPAYENFLYFSFYTSSNLSGAPKGALDEIVIAPISDGFEVDTRHYIHAIVYNDSITKENDSVTFIIDFRQLPDSLAYNAAGESLILTGTIIRYSKPKPNWKWGVIAAGDTSLTPIRTYDAGVNL